MEYLKPLSTSELRQLGILKPWNFGTADITRFGELDALGHVNHTAYLRWFEAFRVRYFKSLDADFYKPGSSTIVLRQIQADYLREMGLDQEYILTGRTSSMGNTSLIMEYGVWSEGHLCATGRAVIVNLGADGKKKSIPETTRKVLVEKDGTEQT